MGWTRFDDNWFVKMEALGLDCTEIGYLQGLIQYCSRSNTYDGMLSAFKARAVTEVEDAGAILAHLHDVGRVLWDGKRCAVLHMDDHLPPPGMREENRKESETSRKRRYRAHLKGDHSLCSSDACPEVVPPGQTRDTVDAWQASPAVVPPGPGTGQDGHGLEEVPAKQNFVTQQPWPSPSTTRPVADLSVVGLDEDDYLGSLGVCGQCFGQGCPACQPAVR